MPRRPALLAALALTALFVSARTVATPDPAAPVAALANAWNRADTAAWGRQFWPDCEFTNIRGEVFHGVAENMAQHGRIWAGPYLGSQFSAKIVRVWPLGPDHALIDSDVEVRGYKALPPGILPARPGVLLTRFRHIVERRHGEWRIVFSQNTVVSPPMLQPAH